MNLNNLMIREETVALLRDARDYATWGWILKGRESTSDMVLDCLGRACGQQEIIVLSPNPSESRALACVCQALYGTDPGGRRGRVKMIDKWNGTAGGTQDGSIRVLNGALDLARTEVVTYRNQSTPAERAKARKQCREKARKLLEKAADLFSRKVEPEERVESVHGPAESAIVAALEVALGRKRGRYGRPLRRQCEPHARLAVEALYKVLVTPHVNPGIHMRRVDEMTLRERNGVLQLEDIAKGFREAINHV